MKNNNFLIFRFFQYFWIGFGPGLMQKLMQITAFAYFACKTMDYIKNQAQNIEEKNQKKYFRSLGIIFTLCISKSDTIVLKHQYE